MHRLVTFNRSRAPSTDRFQEGQFFETNVMDAIENAPEADVAEVRLGNFPKPTHQLSTSNKTGGRLTKRPQSDHAADGRLSSSQTD